MPFLIIPLGIALYLLAPVIAFCLTLVMVCMAVVAILNLLAIAWLAPAELLLRALGICDHMFNAGGWYGGPTGGAYDAAFYSWLAWLGSALCWAAVASAVCLLIEDPDEKRARKQARAIRHDPIARASALLAAELAPREPAYRCVITPPEGCRREFVVFDADGRCVDENGDEHWQPHSTEVPSLAERVVRGVAGVDRSLTQGVCSVGVGTVGFGVGYGMVRTLNRR